MIKVYPDRRWPAFLRVLADTVTVAWTIVWAYLGFLIYQTIMGLEAIADGITSTGATFNGWIASFRNAVPGGIPLLTKFLLDTADALKKYSGDPLVSAGQNIHQAIFQTAVVLALLVAGPPILLVLLPYAGWGWRDMREGGAALAFARIASMTGPAARGGAALVDEGGSSVGVRDVRLGCSEAV